MLGACAAAGPTPRVAMPTNSDAPFVAGYHPYWAEDAWTEYPFDALDELFFFELEVDGSGGVLDAHGWAPRWGEMAGRALASGVQIVPTVSMHDPVAFEDLFPDAQRVDRLISTVIGLLDATPGLSGVHLDFEVFQPVSNESRDGFTGFVAALADRMRREHPALSLSAFALAFDDDDVYNERALGQIVDYLVIQGYDYFSAGSPNAGPVGAVSGWGRLNWDTVVRRFEDFGVPREKLVMGVPLYGYEWPVESDEMGAETRGEGITIPYRADPTVLPELPRARAQADEHGSHRDPSSGSPWYAYRDGEGWRQGWFEDAESLRAKYDFVRTRGLGGIALFPLAYGDEELWEDLRRAFGR